MLHLGVQRVVSSDERPYVVLHKEAGLRDARRRAGSPMRRPNQWKVELARPTRVPTTRRTTHIAADTPSRPLSVYVIATSTSIKNMSYKPKISFHVSLLPCSAFGGSASIWLVFLLGT